MFTFVATLHILVAIGLIFMVLIQDSKGGATGGMFGGGGSQSILGATGAASLFVKVTRWMAVVFALTCIALTLMVAQRSGSVLEGAAPPAAKAIPATSPLDPPLPIGGATAAPNADAGKPAPPANAEKPAEKK
jgi:preprotein translocase subunit SecG